MSIKNYRWQCPNGCPAVLAPSRPRNNDVRRYCLKCSAKAGVLVERIVPVLDLKRAAKQQRARDKAKRARAKERAKTAPERERQRQAKKLAAKKAREAAALRKRYTEYTSEPVGPGWQRVSPFVADTFRQRSVTVLEDASQCAHVPVWAVELNNHRLDQVIRYIARHPQLAAACFAASIIKPILGATMALDHYPFPVAQSIQQTIRKWAGWAPDENGEAFLARQPL